MAGKTAAEPTQVIDGLLWLVVAGCLLYTLVWLAGRRAPRSRLPRRHWSVLSSRPASLRLTGVRLHVWALGVVGITVLPAAAQRRLPDTPSRHERPAAAPPWSATSGFPPPRPLVRIRAFDGDARAPGSGAAHAVPPPPRATQVAGESTRVEERETRSSPIRLGKRAASVSRAPRLATEVESPSTEDDALLFERSGQPYVVGGAADAASTRTTEDKVERTSRDERELALARDRHPAGKALPTACDAALGHHVVVEGDTLWDIARDVLGTDDPGRIARYWPTIHRANRPAIGPDPSLIFPGTVLRLPVECTDLRA